VQCQRWLAHGRMRMVGWSCNWWRQVVAVAKKGGVACWVHLSSSLKTFRKRPFCKIGSSLHGASAPLSRFNRRLPLPTKVKERCNRVCQLEASKRSRVRVGHRGRMATELTSGTSSVGRQLDGAQDLTRAVPSPYFSSTAAVGH
jgi:hypothetical protein